MFSVAVEITKWVKLSRDGEKRYRDCKDHGLCPACKEKILPGETLRREIHLRCYNATFRMVSSGKTTWEERQKQGKIGAKGKPGRKPKNAVTIELAG